MKNCKLCNSNFKPNILQTINADAQPQIQQFIMSCVFHFCSLFLCSSHSFSHFIAYFLRKSSTQVAVNTCITLSIQSNIGDWNENFQLFRAKFTIYIWLAMEGNKLSVSMFSYSNFLSFIILDTPINTASFIEKKKRLRLNVDQ